MMLWILGAAFAAVLVAVALSSDWDGSASPRKLAGRLGIGLLVTFLVGLRIATALAEIAGLVLAVLKIVGVPPASSYGWGPIVLLIVAPLVLWIVMSAILD